MTERSTRHSTIVLERTYAAAPPRVFAAWSDPDALLRWGSPGEGWDVAYERFDFRTGGSDVSRFGPKGGPVFINETTYQDIVPNVRIISAGNMTSEGKRLFAGLLTVEFIAASHGCRVILTEQGVFLDGHDRPENHEAGWDQMLDNLGTELNRDQAAT
ncbi:SRPBCC family protein [Pararhizobium sp.]|uniref:SRPBCC family protein n=1 Tax=Pararhizobium sp. TaxID=1977563 RepID=UPI003D0C8453